MNKTLVCLDQETALHLDESDLGILSFDAFSFVQLASTAAEAREAFSRNMNMNRAFVISTDDFPALNVAAALKKDRPDGAVFVVASVGDTWLLDRSRRAGIDGVISSTRFLQELTRRGPEESEPQIGQQLVQPETVLLLPPREEKMPVQAQGKPLSSTFFMPVVGASGGAGKSTLAFLSALCSSRFGYKTLLLDLDAQLGDMGLFTANEESLSLDQVVENPRLLSELNPEKEGFSLVAACSSLEAAESAAGHLTEIVDAAAPFFDVIVANCPACWAEQQIALLERAAKVLFVLDQRASAIVAAQRAFDLCLRCGLASAPFLFMLNRCGRNAPLSSIDVGCSLKGARCVELPDGGRAVAECLAARQASALADDGNPLYEALETALMDVLPQCGVLKDINRGARLAFSPLSLFKKGRAACL